MIDYYCPECGELSIRLSTTFYMGDGVEASKYECKNGHPWQYVNGKKITNA